MTSTTTIIPEVKPLRPKDIHHPGGRVRLISEERALAMELTDPKHRKTALFHVAALEYTRRAQLLRDQGISRQCAQIEVMKDGVPNPDRPFLTWTCCPEHRVLKDERAELRSTAGEIGVELNFDVSQIIEL
jgi:hypothetical protein